MTQGDEQHGGDRFPPTRRSVIEAVRSIDAEERERALEALCAAYWKPVYKYIRLRWNRPADAAQDLTQGFFMELLERELLDKFDSKKSRLRTYLRLCVDSFVMNEDKAGRRLKRGGNVLHVALDFSTAEEELGAAVMDPAAIPSPESLEDFLRWRWRNCANCARRKNARGLFSFSKLTTSTATRRFLTSNWRRNMESR
jgi:hypothetical protein